MHYYYYYYYLEIQTSEEKKKIVMKSLPKNSGEEKIFETSIEQLNERPHSKHTKCILQIEYLVANILVEMANVRHTLLQGPPFKCMCCVRLHVSFYHNL